MSRIIKKKSSLPFLDEGRIDAGKTKTTNEQFKVGLVLRVKEGKICI